MVPFFESHLANIINETKGLDLNYIVQLSRWQTDNSPVHKCPIFTPIRALRSTHGERIDDAIELGSWSIPGSQWFLTSYRMTFVMRRVYKPIQVTRQWMIDMSFVILDQ